VEKNVDRGAKRCDFGANSALAKLWSFLLHPLSYLISIANAWLGAVTRGSRGISAECGGNGSFPQSAMKKT
jgi:hypothetical protein